MNARLLLFSGIVFMLVLGLLPAISAYNVTIQPGSTGNDVWIENSYNKNSYNFLAIGKQSGYNKKRMLIEFSDLSAIPSGSTITKATMSLNYYKQNCGLDTPISRTLAVHKLLRDFAESQATKDIRFTNNTWNESYVGLNNIDALNSSENSTFVTSTPYNRWISFDITNAVIQWKASDSTNKGLVIYATNENTNGCDMRFYSSEISTLSLRPKLEIIYTVNTSNGTCIRQNPLVNITPPLQNGTAGSSKLYTVSVKNNDNTYCGASTFSLQKYVPTYWSGILGQSSITLSPSITGYTNLTVTSWINATAGIYNFTVTATNNVSTNYTGAAIAQYMVS
jgi:hypothetical protein